MAAARCCENRPRVGRGHIPDRETLVASVTAVPRPVTTATCATRKYELRLFDSMIRDRGFELVAVDMPVVSFAWGCLSE